MTVAMMAVLTFLKANDIKLILFTDNKGKGHALRSGIKEAVNDRIKFMMAIWNQPSDILKLMILDKSSGIKSVMDIDLKSLIHSSQVLIGVIYVYVFSIFFLNLVIRIYFAVLKLFTLKI